MNVSPSFALPLKIVAPYFLFGIIAYTLSISSLAVFNNIPNPSDIRLIGSVHLFLLGFVMMIIIGAMGQLSVVVGEIHHRHPSLFQWIFPLFGVGIGLLVYGFYFSMPLLPYGSFLILIGLGLFAYNLFVSLKKSRRRTAITRSMQWSTLFLGIGIIIGSVMALGYAGELPINPHQWLFSHLVSLLGGYVLLNIMGVTTVLLPMFGACPRPSDNDHAISFYTMFSAVILGLLNGFIPYVWLQTTVLGLALLSVLYYMKTVFQLFTSRKRHYSDIWERSVTTAYIFLIIALISGIYGWLTHNSTLLIVGFWLLFGGFLSFLIFAHLYKIVPFLVWFERYAPRIEDENVPTLQQMISERWAMNQWFLAVAGVICITMAILINTSLFWYIGIAILTLSGGVMMGVIIDSLKR